MLEIVWKIMLGIYIMILFYLTLAGRKQVDPFDKCIWWVVTI